MVKIRGVRKGTKKSFVIVMVVLLIHSIFPTNPSSLLSKNNDLNEILEVDFNGNIQGNEYVAEENEQIKGSLTIRSGNEQLTDQQMILNGDSDGMEFTTLDALGEEYVDQSIIVETIFNPKESQDQMGTLVAIGGNIYARYSNNDPSKLEYGFDVRNESGWHTEKEVISAPNPEEEHTFVMVYSPTANGATIRAYLNGKQLTTVTSENGKPPIAGSQGEEANALGIGNDVHPAGKDRGFKGSILKAIATIYSGEFNESMLKTITPDPDEPTNKQDILDVYFTGAFSSEAGYTNATGEIMDGMLTQKSGNEEIVQGSVPLNGGTEGINFQPRESFILDGNVTKPFIMEVEFVPEANQNAQDTLLAFGGNMYARYTSSSEFEYGFEVNNNGSWSSAKEQIAAPEAGQRHAFAFAYIPKENGAEMHAFLNGEALPVVTSNSQAAIAGNIENEFAFGNDVHPAALERGFNGSVSSAVVTTFEGAFNASLLKTMELTKIDRKLLSYWQGDITEEVYTGSDDELVDGVLDIVGGVKEGLGKINLSGEGAHLTFTPSNSEEGTNIFEDGFISEVLIAPSLLDKQVSLFQIGDTVSIKSAADGKNIHLILNGERTQTYDLSQYVNEEYIHLSFVYELNNNTISLKMLVDTEKVGDTVDLSKPLTISSDHIVLSQLNEDASGNILGVAHSSLEGPFRETQLMLTGGACFVPEDIEPSFEIEISGNECAAAIAAKASYVRPKPKQVEWQQYEQTAFIHYGINTYYGVEWGGFNLDTTKFNPTNLNTDQWARALKESGFKMAVLTVKHHDGFLLYQSRYSNYGVASSPYKDGQGDVLKEFAESMRKYGIDVGVYLSPGDHDQYSKGVFGNNSERKVRTIPTLVENDDRIGDESLPQFELPVTDYGEYMLNQLYEVLTEYGEIKEVWFDGAQGHIPGDVYEPYDWDSYYTLIEELAPEAVIAVTGQDVRWVGNESGWARENEWSVLATTTGENGRQSAYPSHHSSDLGSRDVLRDAAANGMDHLRWWPAEVDVSIRPGWFYHDNQQPKSVEHLRNIYYNSIARNSVLLLNIPPNKEGKFAEQDVKRLKEWHESIKRDFAIDYTENAKATAEVEGTTTDATDVVDGDYDTSWHTDSTEDSKLYFKFDDQVEVKRIILQENINFGQQVESFVIDAKDSNGNWEEIYTNEVIGYKRIITLDDLVTSDEFRLRILQSRGPVYISEVGFYQTLPEGEPLPDPVDTTELENLIKEASDISNQENQYTEESFTALQAAITEAESALEKVETEEELQAAIDALQIAIDGLENNIPDPVDTTELESLIKEASDISNQENQYTEESFTALQAAITQAESALEKVETEEELQSAIDTLQTAIDGLQTIDPDEGDIEKQPTIHVSANKQNNQAIIESTVLEKLAENGEIVIDITELDIEELLLTSEQVSKLIQLNAKIKVEKNDVELSMMSALLKEREDLTITITPISQSKINKSDSLEIIGSIYHFTIEQDETINQFEDYPVTLTFKVEPFEKGRQAGVYYFNEKTNEWELIGGDLSNGMLTANTAHFSIFAPMRVVSTTEQPGVDSDSNESNNENIGDNLPDTATSTYNWVVVGLLFILFGAIIAFMFFRKRSKEEIN
ncbi:Alpha-L-fucosidase [Paraliobacillus sp. PM-2]|uniref:alpha-L-fucosidase n=1 Tax=Paraliobacillus sp. PM-2 TaxID=1462524 RepID=UPI00061BFCD1|nr:alpha-L-fucosidase [Paraliobacillus sp. PM-2]CQR48094.1 Alpha-L-fucosidase [Paraliobacillus sp. PM-2]